jgi:hypothetical protein
MGNSPLLNQAINIMLLNEFLKDHKKVEKQQTIIGQLKSTAAKQEATISELTKSIEVLTGQLQEHATKIQTVRTEIEASRPLSRVALSNP